MFAHDVETNGRLLAKLTRALLRAETFESLPDLTEALKCRCATLRIRYSPDDITDAYRLIRSNTPLPGDPERPPILVERPPEPDLFPRHEAADLLARLREHVGALAIRRMPRVWKPSAAAQWLATEIVASIARCEALEAHPAADAVGLSVDSPIVTPRVKESSSSSSSSNGTC